MKQTRFTLNVVKASRFSWLSSSAWSLFFMRKMSTEQITEINIQFVSVCVRHVSLKMLIVMFHRCSGHVTCWTLTYQLNIRRF